MKLKKLTHAVCKTMKAKSGFSGKAY